MTRPTRNRSARTRRRNLRPWLDVLEDRTLLSIFTVNSPDDNTSDTSVLTLRDAITLVDSGGDPTSLGQPTMPSGWATQIDSTGGGFGTNDTIDFNMPGTGVHTIQSGGLPGLTRPATIDGYSQAGSSRNTLAVGDNAVLTIELSGPNIDSTTGLQIQANNSLVQGLVINGFDGHNSIGLAVTGANDVIQGCFIGTDPSGTLARPNYTGVATGPGSRVGVDGHDAHPEAERNVVSGNDGFGIDASSGSVIAGNYIGVDTTGAQPLPNGFLLIGSNIACSIALGDNNLVGSDGDGVGDEYERNVISGTYGSTSYGAGIFVFGTGNQIAGNYIGTDATGRNSLGQQGFGVILGGGSNDNVLGYDSRHLVANPAGQRNVISGNISWGVEIRGDGNVVAENFIGTDLTGTMAVPNGTGIIISGGNHNLIGTVNGSDELERNIISGNANDGVDFVGGGDDYNVVGGNYIGLDVTGTFSLTNGPGVFLGLSGGSGIGNTIGGTTAAARNVISAAWHGDGIRVDTYIPGSYLSQTIIAGNYIGTDKTGRTTTDPHGVPLGGGIRIADPGVTGTIIEGNVIAGNRADGIEFDGGSIGIGSTGTLIEDNWIGTNPYGDNLGNRGSGVQVSQATNTQIGGPGSLSNTIAFNGGVGVAVTSTSTGNSIRGNSIHDNALGISVDPNIWPFPVLSAAYAGASTVLMGTLNSTPNSTFTIDFYGNAAPDYAGYFEGQTYLGSTTVITDSTGYASIEATSLAAAGLGQWITATATFTTYDAGNYPTYLDTSEFSQGKQVTKALTTTTLTASANPSLLNQQVTFTATIATPITGLDGPTGTVQFMVDGSNFGSAVPLSSNTASFTTSALSVGPHTVQAVYSGDSLFLGSSASLTQSVQFKFGGFLAPLTTGVSYALGRTIPIKFTLANYAGIAVTSLAAVTGLQIVPVNPGGAAFTPVSTDGKALTSSGGQYMFNWQTKGLAAGSFQIQLNLADGTTQTKTIQLQAGGGAAGLMADTSGTSAATTSGALLGGDLTIAVNDPNGLLTADQQARISDAISLIDVTVAPYGVTITQIDPSSGPADVTIDTSSTSAVGGYADGVLGCESGTGVTLIQGWNWYAGADPTAIQAGQFDFETVVMHELGHVLGLGHSADATSVMSATLGAGTANRNLTVADLNVPDTDGGGASGLHARVPRPVPPAPTAAAPLSLSQKVGLMAWDLAVADLSGAALTRTQRKRL
jgi:hypothetical protein